MNLELLDGKLDLQKLDLQLKVSSKAFSLLSWLRMLMVLILIGCVHATAKSLADLGSTFEQNYQLTNPPNGGQTQVIATVATNNLKRTK